MSKNGSNRVLSDDELIKRIKKEVEDLTTRENLSDSGKGFVLWILINYFDLDNETALIDSPNDKRVDAFIEEDETIKIIQCKFFGSIRKEVGGNEIVLFKGCLDWLKKPEEVKKLNLPNFYEAARTFSERWNENVDIQLHFFAFGKFSAAANHERKVFNNSDLRERVQMYFHDIEDILTVYKSKLQVENPLANEKVTLELISGEYFVKKGDMPAIVATIKGKELLEMYRKYGDALFERNIRFYKGARKGSINAKIIDTVLDNNERKKFWYYNNGISFVCQDFTINEKMNPPVLEVTGFQVINGCQTTVCLSDAHQRAEWESIPEEVQIVVRFIKAPVKEVDLITLYTNSQNPVSEIQLRSNDPIQKRLKEELANFTPPYFYSIKEGDWQRLARREKTKFGGRVIEMSKAAQAIYSFRFDPAFARRWRNKLFSEKYYQIFRRDMVVEEIILPWIILYVIDKKIGEYRREEFNKFKKEPTSFTETQQDEIRRKEFLIYSNLIILYFIGELIKKRYEHYSPQIAKKLLNAKLPGRIERIFDYIVSILKFSPILSQETNIPRFLKNFDNIKVLFDEIQRAIDMDRARTDKNPLNYMLPEIREI